MLGGRRRPQSPGKGELQATGMVQEPLWARGAELWGRRAGAGVKVLPVRGCGCRGGAEGQHMVPEMQHRVPGMQHVVPGMQQPVPAGEAGQVPASGSPRGTEPGARPRPPVPARGAYTPRSL